MSENAGPSSARRERRQARHASPNDYLLPLPPPLEPPEPIASNKPAPELPLELIQSIVDYACEDLQPLAERRNCRNLALIGRDWRETAQRRIFRELAITSTRALARAASTFSKSPRVVGRFVRDLSLHFTLEELHPDDLAQLYESCSGLRSMRLTATYDKMRILVSTLPSTPAGRAVASIRLRHAEPVTPATDDAFIDDMALLLNLKYWEFAYAGAVTFAGTRLGGLLPLTQIHVGYPPEYESGDLPYRINYGSPQWSPAHLQAVDICCARLTARMTKMLRAASSMVSLRFFDCQRPEVDRVIDVLNACPSLRHFDLQSDTLGADRTQALLDAIPPSLVTLVLDLSRTFESQNKMERFRNFLTMRESAALRRQRLNFVPYCDVWTKESSTGGVRWSCARIQEFIHED